MAVSCGADGVEAVGDVGDVVEGDLGAVGDDVTLGFGEVFLEHVVGDVAEDVHGADQVKGLEGDEEEAEGNWTRGQGGGHICQVRRDCGW